MFQIKKDYKQVIILGTGSGYNLAPVLSNKLVYALNDYAYKKKYPIEIDKLFIMDVLDEKPLVVAGISNLGDLVSKINELKVPLIAPFRYEEIPLSEVFPIEEVAKAFGAPYFSNTISYMIAYTLLEFLKNGFNLNECSIELFGINQSSSTEYFYEKAGVEYWLGVANGLGVSITINGERSELLTNKKRFGGNLLYGYNQTYEEIQGAKEKFGEAVVRKLMKPPSPKKRNISRRIN